MDRVRGLRPRDTERITHIQTRRLLLGVMVESKPQNKEEKYIKTAGIVKKQKSMLSLN